MRFLIDENLSPSIAEALRELGQEAVTVVELGLRGSPDAELTQLCNANGWIFVTRDVELARFPSDFQTGLVLMRFPAHFSARGIAAEFRRLMPERLPVVEGRMVVLSPGRSRSGPLR